jgi:tetratricopeptide (TPR) repeat protein
MIFKTIHRLIQLKGLSVKTFGESVQRIYLIFPAFRLQAKPIRRNSTIAIKFLFLLLVFTGLIFHTSGLLAQQSLSLINGRTPFEKGLELYEKQKYSAARHLFEETIKQTQTDYSLYRSEAQYYVAMCAIQLYNEDAELLLTKYIAENSQSPRINDASYEMAKFEYGKKKYRDAVKWFKKVEKSKLSHDDQPEYSFKSGYSYYMNGDTVNAKLAFFEIRY